MNAGNGCLVLTPLVLTPVLYLCRPWGRRRQGPVQQLLVQNCSKQQRTSCFDWLLVRRHEAWAGCQFCCEVLVDDLIYLALSCHAFYTDITLPAHKLVSLLL